MIRGNTDVISLPVELDGKEIDSKFRLVIGAMPTISTKARKVTTAALEEVVSGSVRVLTGEAAVKAEEEAGKLTYEKMIDEAEQKVSLPENLTELEKDVKDYLRQKEEMDK
jgi:hypothetical protein